MKGEPTFWALKAKTDKIVATSKYDLRSKMAIETLNEMSSAFRSISCPEDWQGGSSLYGTKLSWGLHRSLTK